MNRKARFLYPLIFALILAAVTFAYAAANTVPGSGAGDGSGAISGYTVSNVHYVLSTTDPSVIDQVTFSLAGAPTPTTVKIQLVTGGSWYSCTESGGTWTCNVGGAVTVLAADNLRVVAAQ